MHQLPFRTEYDHICKYGRSNGFYSPQPLSAISSLTMTSTHSPNLDLEKHRDDQVAQAPGRRVKAAALVIEEDSDAGSANLVYREKVAVLNDALQEIGMGRYQW